MSVVDFYFFDVSSFTFTIVLGAALALALGSAYARRIKLPRDLFWSAAVVVTLVGIVGARLYHVALHPDYYSANPDEILSFDQGGLAWHGGLLAGMLAMYVFSIITRASFSKIADAFAVGLPFALALGWLGAHANGLYYGALNESWLAQELPDQFGIYDLRFPVQLATSLWFALVFVLLLVFARRDLPLGRIAAVFLLASAVGNFVFAFYRGDETLMWNTWRVDQWIDLALGAFGLILLLTRRAQVQVRLRVKPLVVSH